MKIMLDTNICIYIIKRRPQPVLDHFAAYQVSQVGISIITMAELEYGADKSSDPARNREALQEFTSPLEVAAFDRPASLHYGKIRAALEQKGKPIGAMALLIAAHALSLGVPLVTNNEREFKRVPGLQVEKWT